MSESAQTPQQGLHVPLTDENRDEAIEWSLTYRGDVTVICSSGEQTMGYAFDADSKGQLRVDPSDGSPRTSIPIDEITAIEFSGRDTAAGKSFERWIERYVEQTLAGEAPAIASEDLEKDG